MNMRGKYHELNLAVLLGIVFPAVLFTLLQRSPIRDDGNTTATNPTQIVTTTADSTNSRLPVLLLDGSVDSMDLEEYVTCVLLAEMPAEFEPEALKAQAVVARTYTLKRYKTEWKHQNAAVCTDATCCQAYCNKENYLQNEESVQMFEKISNAVESTKGQVLTYNGSLIEATYFSCSGGRTEDALAVWGTEIPYLQAVDSPGEESAAHYMETVSFSIQEFSELLDISLTGDWLGEITYTDGGGVDTIKIGSKTYKGTEVRQKLSLRSTAFVVTPVGNTVTVTTKGFGHRVGMSQYGAEAMAVQGSAYTEILSYYYSGTQLQQY